MGSGVDGRIRWRGKGIEKFLVWKIGRWNGEGSGWISVALACTRILTLFPLSYSPWTFSSKMAGTDIWRSIKVTKVYPEVKNQEGLWDSPLARLNMGPLEWLHQCVEVGFN